MAQRQTRRASFEFTVGHDFRRQICHRDHSVAAVGAVVRTTAFSNKATHLMLQAIFLPVVFCAFENLTAITMVSALPLGSAATANVRLFVCDGSFAAEAKTRMLAIFVTIELDRSTISEAVVTEEEVWGHPRFESCH